MIINSALLIDPALKAGIKVPDDITTYDPEEYPHWDIYCVVQLELNSNSNFTNAKIIAKISEDKLKTLTWKELLKLGFEVNIPIP